MKVFFVLVSFLVINFNLLGCSLGQQIAEPVIYLMPEGYMGNVYIFHDVPDGFPLKREDRARVYEIPKDGILQSQSPEISGLYSRRIMCFF